ncbi:hypothetical protein R3P38DRAFT_3168862 [Favolaschia claudopus]|uniref:F-box domain-containing protein n=1 Tax=Favolaschia claudopus TaxID=2862362 RepID=A0AAW0DYB6_9AGAR
MSQNADGHSRYAGWPFHSNPQLIVTPPAIGLSPHELEDLWDDTVRTLEPPYRPQRRAELVTQNPNAPPLPLQLKCWLARARSFQRANEAECDRLRDELSRQRPVPWGGDAAQIAQLRQLCIRHDAIADYIHAIVLSINEHYTTPLYSLPLEIWDLILRFKTKATLWHEYHFDIRDHRRLLMTLRHVCSSWRNTITSSSFYSPQIIKPWPPNVSVSSFKLTQVNEIVIDLLMASAEDIQGIQALLDDTSIHVLTLDHMNCTFSSRYYWETTMPLMPEVLSLTSTAKTLRIRGWEGGEDGFTMEREDELLETNAAVQRTPRAGALFSGISQLIVLNTLAPELCWDIPWHNLVNYAEANVIGRQPETLSEHWHRLQGLVSLSLSGMNTFPPADNPTIHLPVLARLNVQVDYVEEFHHTLLHALQCPSLASLHISSEDRYDNDQATRQARIAWFEHSTLLFLERSGASLRDITIEAWHSLPGSLLCQAATHTPSLVRLELGGEYGYDADMCQLLHSESLWPRLATLRLPEADTLSRDLVKTEDERIWVAHFCGGLRTRFRCSALRVADFTATIRGEGPSTRDELWEEESEWGNGRIVALPPGLRDALAVLHLEGYAVRWRVPSDDDLDHKARMLLQEAFTDQP